MRAVFQKSCIVYLNTKNNKYYKLALRDDESLTISVPIENKLGFLRKPITIEEANHIISNIPNIQPIITNDKLIENEYKNSLKYEH